LSGNLRGGAASNTVDVEVLVEEDGAVGFQPFLPEGIDGREPTEGTKASTPTM